MTNRNLDDDEIIIFPNKMKRFCPGLYCGRVWLENGSLSECGACPRGYRTQKSVCEPCRQDLQLYDWIYLSFMVVIYVLIQLFFIDKSTKSNRFNFVSFVLYTAIVAEAMLAALLSLWTFSTDDGDDGDGGGPFSLTTCGVKSFSDWYTLFYNPSLNETFHCTHEAVYPLYSIIFLFYLISLALVFTRNFYIRLISCAVFLLTRSPQVKKLHSRDYLTQNIYYVLYSIPALIFIHAMFAGIIYYIFPYLLIIGSVISIAIHLSYHIDQSYRYLLRATTTQFRNLAIVLGHWALHAFGIVALTELKHHYHYLLLLLVPFPTLFYIFTAKFSDPAKL